MCASVVAGTRFITPK